MASPILVYQMGKVGSTTIKHTLDYYAISNYQIHYLNEKTLDRIEARHLEKDLKVPLHIRRSKDVLEQGLLEEKPIKVISLVRDPVARNISAFFQNIESYFTKSELQAIDIETLIETFLNEYPHHISINWFEKELQANLDIDVCDIVDDKNQAYFTTKHKNVELLLIKVEASDDEKSKALADFVELPKNFELVSGNIGEDKSYSDIYIRFKDKIKFPKSYLDEMYKSKLIESIYPKDEIERMRKRWT
jgi:hypothetical protein